MLERIKNAFKGNPYVQLYACDVCHIVRTKAGFCPICKCQQKWHRVESGRFGNSLGKPATYEAVEP